MLIADENNKQIRTAMEVYVSIHQKTGIQLNFTATDYAAADLATLETQEIDLANLADLSGSGFPLDGSCRLYDPTETPTAQTGKIGLRSNVGQAMSLTVTSETEIPALTFKMRGNGEITANGEAYEIRSFVVIPINANTATITITPNADERVEIDDITSGVTLELDNDNLIRVNCDLETDLNIVEPNWNVSAIEVEAYWPDDISEAVSGMGDGVPIIYYSGYPGDYSEPRYFYLSEEVTQKDGVITLRGEDASTRLENVTITDLLWTQTRQNARRGIYQRFRSIIKEAGITLAHDETDPPLIGTDKEKYYMGLQECSGRDLIAYLMGMIFKNGFYPRYIDAGIPTLKWQTPAVEWTIYEDDVADLETKTDRNINVIRSSEADRPLHTVLTMAKNRETIDTKNVTAGKSYKIDYQDNRYIDIQIKGGVGKIVKQSLESVTIEAVKTTEKIQKKVLTGFKKYQKKYNTNSKAAVILEPPKVIDGYKTNVTKKKSGNYIVYTWREPKFSYRTEYQNQLIVTGRRVVVPNAVQPGETALTVDEVTAARVGVTKETNPLILGCFNSNYENSSYYIPNYNDLFTRSNKGGSFKFYGNPHIQPRDVFKLIRLDGSEITATIESVTLEHEAGGLISEITYREGII